MHQKIYKNSEKLLFSKFQQKITGKLCCLLNLKVMPCLGHSSTQKNTRISKTFDNFFTFAGVIKSDTAKIFIYRKFNIEQLENCFFRGTSKTTSCSGHPSAPEYVKISRKNWNKGFSCSPVQLLDIMIIFFLLIMNLTSVFPPYLKFFLNIMLKLQKSP